MDRELVVIGGVGAVVIGAVVLFGPTGGNPLWPRLGLGLMCVVGLVVGMWVRSGPPSPTIPVIGSNIRRSLVGTLVSFWALLLLIPTGDNFTLPIKLVVGLPVTAGLVILFWFDQPRKR